MAGWRATLLLVGMAAVAAATNSTSDPFASPDQTQLCACPDLLWTPQPSGSAAPEVINWHNKLVQEVTAAEAHGVRVCHGTRWL